MAKKFGGLGKGLGALIDTNEEEVNVDGASSINEVKISEIEANPDQPRRDFDEEALSELSDSIKQIGVIQPITLRKIDENKYQIIAGERRYRASKMAGLESIPAYVKEVNEEQMMEMALVENIQREDLNAIEVALSYQNLMEKCDYTQDQLSDRVGKKRTTITNYIRLLRLPAEIQMGIKDRKIDMGHARALINVEDPVKQLDIYNQIIRNGYSVRKVEELVRLLNFEKKSEEQEKNSQDNDLRADYSMLKDRLSTLFSAKIDLVCNAKGKGKITIPFKSDDEFAKIMEIFDSIQN